MGKPEAKIEDYLRRRVKETGGKIRKIKFIGRNGAPDNMVWYPAMTPVFVECKREGGDVDWASQQGREITRMREDGLRVEVVNSFASVEVVLKIAQRVI